MASEGLLGAGARVPGAATTAARASGGAALPSDASTTTTRGFGWLWTLNACAAAVHAAWVVVFACLWALDERADGSKRDITYPMYYAYATFGSRPEPPTLAVAGVNAEALRSDLEDALPEFFARPGVGLFSPYPACPAPLGAEVGAMEVLPAWRDSGLTLSLHWLVWSFFALSFLFQTAAAVVDAVDVVRRRRRRRTIMGDDRATASAYERAAGDGAQQPSPPRDDNTKPAGPSASDSDDAAASRGSSARWLRFVEYSFSASVMIVAIALQVGIMDGWTLFLLAALTWTTMILGLVGERILGVERDLMLAADASHRRRTTATENCSGDVASNCAASRTLALCRWASHFAGWVTMGATFVVIIAHFFSSQRTCEFEDDPDDGADDANVAPDFVYAIVFCELALFALFGATQFAQFARFEKNPRVALDDRWVEAAYIAQSLVSKTLLGWLVYGGNFVEG